jgi:hypothetical protein
MDMGKNDGKELFFQLWNSKIICRAVKALVVIYVR